MPESLKVGGRVWSWEAMGVRVGRPCSLIGSEIWSDLSYPMRGAQLPTASHGLPLSDSLAHGLPHFVMKISLSTAIAIAHLKTGSSKCLDLTEMISVLLKCVQKLSNLLHCGRKL